MGSIDASLQNLSNKLDDAINNTKEKQTDHEHRIGTLEDWKTSSTARTGAVAVGTALTVPPLIKWLLDTIGG